MIASMPLICCSTSSDKPINSGIRTGRVKNTDLFFLVSLVSFTPSSRAILMSAFSAGIDNGGGNFSQAADFSA